MVKKPTANNRREAFAPPPSHRTRPFALLTVLFLFLTGHAIAQTRMGGDQLRIATNRQTGATYSIVPSDCGKLLSFSGASTVAVSLPQAGASGLANGCWIDIQNAGAANAVFTSANSLVDGETAFTLAPNQGLRLYSNGTSYFAQRGQGSGSGGSSLTLKSGGTSLGRATALDVVGGTGVTCVPQLNDGVATFQCNADTSFLASKAALQGSTNPQICTSASGSGEVYTAACATALSAYAPKQTLYWFADVANTSATPTLNIDTLGPIGLARHDGASLAVNDIKPGALYRIWYDGTRARVVEAGLTAGSGGGSPDGSGPTGPTGPAGPQGPVGPTGATGATGPAGPAGPAGPSGSGGGGASAGGSAGPSGSLAMNGSDVTIYTFSNVPSLAAGQCYEIKGVVTSTANSTAKLKVDGTTVINLTSAGNITGGYYFGFDYFYCNSPGIQNAQTFSPLMGWYTSTGQYQQAGGLTNYFPSGAGGYPLAALSNIDWATSHTITVTMSAASGTGQALFFRYN